MSLLVAPFVPHHLTLINTQPGQRKDLSIFGNPRYGESLAQGGPAFTVFNDGEVVACLGVFDYWEGRGACWAVLSGDLKTLMVGLTRRISAWFEQSDYRRLECSVDPNFPEARRWARLLNFQEEGLMRKYTPSGADHLLYARVRSE